MMARGHHVVLACRRHDACEAARRELAARCPAGSAQCSPLDLLDYASASPASVTSFARRFALEFPGAQLAALVNNASVMGAPPGPGGEDPHLSPNHFGPFLLTRLLLPSMAPHARIVTVGSEAHRRGSLELEREGELEGEKNSGGGGAVPAGRRRLRGGRGAHWYRQYARSKLANALMTAELNRRLEARGSTVTACCASPGRVATNIFHSLGGVLGPVLRSLASLAFQTPQQGASTVVQAATAPELQGRRVLYMHAGGEQAAAPAALDPALARGLWEVSVRETGMSAAQDDALWPNW